MSGQKPKGIVANRGAGTEQDHGDALERYDVIPRTQRVVGGLGTLAGERERTVLCCKDSSGKP